MAAATIRAKKAPEFKWHDAQVVYENDDGYKVLYLASPEDLALLGTAQGHCSASHWPWASEEPRLFYFFTVVGADMTPHCTVHAKQKKWFKKVHPKDTAPRIPWEGARNDWGYYRVACSKCRGYGGLKKANGAPYYKDYPGVKTCDHCKGTGNEPEKKHDKVNFTLKKPTRLTPLTIAQAFKDAGKEYVEGEWGTHSFESTAYDTVFDYGDTTSWDKCYTAIPKKPDFVTDEQWEAYTKNWKAMKDIYDKQVGNVKIGGRVFKFDSKELLVLSYQSRGDGYRTGNTGGVRYRAAFGEFLIECNKKKATKEVAA
jgi:hypothetical protein